MLARAEVTLDARPIDDVLRRMRAIKRPAELQLMRRAGGVADNAYRAGVAEVRPGATEHHIAATIAGTMVRDGAEPLYMIQVGSGPRSGFRNVRPTGRVLENGDMVYIGFGLRYQGYCMRIGGSTTVGQPDTEQRRFLEANVSIVEEGMRAARAGVRTSLLVDVAEAAAEAHGVRGDLWAGGHGIGAHTHDLPVIAKLSDHLLETGMAFVFEPMLIRSGFGTANAERVYAVTEDGAEPLSSVPLRSW
jgi:Xaa-Pro aminopeptidase